MIKLPEKFENKMKELLQDEYDNYLQCYDEPRYYGLRVNTNIETSILFCRIVLSSGAECNDACKPYSG